MMKRVATGRLMNETHLRVIVATDQTANAGARVRRLEKSRSADLRRNAGDLYDRPSDGGAASQTRHDADGALAADRRGLHAIAGLHHGQKRDHPCAREIDDFDRVAGLLQQNALLVAHVFEVGGKECEIDRRQRRQEAIGSVRAA